jgi:hypothetical protein
VSAQRPGALERAGLALDDWHETRTRLAGTEAGMVAVLAQIQPAHPVLPDQARQGRRAHPRSMTFRSSPRRSGTSCVLGQELFQVTANPLPLLFSAPGCASTAPLRPLTIVISSSVNEEITPDVDPAATALPLSVHVPKSVSG